MDAHEAKNVLHCQARHLAWQWQASSYTNQANAPKTQPVSQWSWPSNCLAWAKSNVAAISPPPSPLFPAGNAAYSTDTSWMSGRNRDTEKQRHRQRHRQSFLGGGWEGATKLSLDTNSKSINDKNQQKLHGWVYRLLAHTHCQSGKCEMGNGKWEMAAMSLHEAFIVCLFLSFVHGLPKNLLLSRSTD